MGNLLNSLNKLKSNIFGGKGNTGFTKPPATRVAKLGIKDTPTSLLSVDPLAFASFSYPKDITNNIENGHYMLFYINVQNKTKFPYTRAVDGVTVQEKEITTKKITTETGAVPQLGYKNIVKDNKNVELRQERIHTINEKC